MDTKQKNRMGSQKRPAGQGSAQQHAAAARRNAQQTNREAQHSRTTARTDTDRQEAARRAAAKKEAARRAAAKKEAARRAAAKKAASSQEKQKKPQKQASSFFGKKSPVSAQERARKERAARSAERRRTREARQKRESRMPTPVVVYTQPAAFNRNRLLVQLATIVAVVLALVLGLSVFFKVETITVSGAEAYSAWTVREASGISEGDNLLTFSRARASAKIRAELPYVDKVRIGIKLPDTVNIYIEELDVVYSIQSSDGNWWLMTSGGRIVQQTDGGTAETYTKVEGVVLESPKLNEQAVAKEETPTETDEAGNVIPLAVTNSQRLNAALQILEALESNDVVGEAASVDVTNLGDIELWYGTQYQVDLGDTSRMEEKISWMKSVVAQMGEYDTGVLDITFTTWADQVGYTPFD